VAAAVLDEAGVREADVRAAAADFVAPSAVGANRPRQSEEADAALRQAAALARQAGCASVGTEHLLYAIAFDPGSRARRVLAHVHADLAVIKKELTCYVEPARPRRRRGRRSS
jgi:Clp amino terminal domain, pathogenicity island component